MLLRILLSPSDTSGTTCTPARRLDQHACLCPEWQHAHAVQHAVSSAWIPAIAIVMQLWQGKVELFFRLGFGPSSMPAAAQS